MYSFLTYCLSPVTYTENKYNQVDHILKQNNER